MPDIDTDGPAARRFRLRLFYDFLKSSVLFWVPALVFIGVAVAVRGNRPLPGDIAVLQFLYTLSSPLLDSIFIVITFLGSGAVVVPIAAFVAIALYRKCRRGDALYILFSIGGTIIINQLLKVLFGRSRPELWEQIITEQSYSFPSGHAMLSSAVAFTAILLLWSTRYRWRAVIGGAAYFLLVSLSRLYLGVHYPSDVIAGWIVSFIWALFLYRIFSRYRRTELAKRQSRK